MKITVIILNLFAVYVFFAIFQTLTFSCPKCNEDFYKQLLTNRANTLGGEELLRAIENQSEGGEPPNFNLPSSYSSLTDLKEPDASVTTYSKKKEFSAPGTDTGIYHFLTFFAKIMIFGKLIVCSFLISGNFLKKYKMKKALLKAEA